jgi:predicted PurR-regulated permease PerM
VTNNKLTFSRRIVPWIALTGLISLAFVILTPFLVPIAWASVISYVSWPIAKRIHQWCNGRDTLAASINTLLAAVTLFIPIIWLAWIAQNEVTYVYPLLNTFLNAPLKTELIKSLPWLDNLIGNWLTQQVQIFNNPQGLSAAIKAWLALHVIDVANLAGGIGRNLIKLIFVIVILFFFYRDGKKIISELRHVLAKYIGPQAHEYLHAAGITTRAVVYGVLLTALVQGAVAGIGYWVAGLSSPVIFGVITAIVALIPFCTPIAWGSAGLWLLVQGQTTEAIGVWVWGAAVVSQLDNILRPIFISSVSPIPFLLVLFGVLGGLLAFGLVGLFIGPTVLAVAWAVWKEWTAHLHDSTTSASFD